MKRAFAALAAFVAVGVLATSAFAITDGELDGNGHPYVGLMVAQGADGNPLWRCSGTLMSPTVFLTAGHCTEAPAAHVEIWFAAGPIDNDPDYVSVAAGGTGCANPAVDGIPLRRRRRWDAVHASGVRPGRVLPPRSRCRHARRVGRQERPTARCRTEDVLDGLKTKRGQKDLTFTAVGYGLQKSFPDAAVVEGRRPSAIRMVAHPKLIQINNGYVGDFSILLSQQRQHGRHVLRRLGGTKLPRR